ncbi:MAG: CCA tRNA nucleotidyltransferase [Lachnospiraceae bacterium]
MKIVLPKEVDSIIRTLNEAGYEAYAVGGCVRDSLLQVTPKDWDITTSATPGQVKALFSRTIDTGIVHGTVTVMMGKEGYEVTTYRVDGEYEDGRHPKEVTFTASLTEDLRRRDFTINAMAYHPTQGLVDVFEGRKDLQKGIIRCVGDAVERFSEDALRMLRAVRFSAQLGFDIEEKTYQAMKLLAGNLQKVSVERIWAEFSKLLCSPCPEKLQFAHETGLLEQFLPKLCRKMCEPSVREATLARLKESPADLWIRLAVLFCDLAEEPGEAQTIRDLRYLKTDLHTIKLTGRLVAAAGEPLPGNETQIRILLSKWGEELFDRWLILKQVRENADIHQIRQQKEEILRRGDCISIPQLAINGSDLLALGVQQGKEVGEMLERLLRLCLIHPEENEKERLKAQVLAWKE